MLPQLMYPLKYIAISRGFSTSHKAVDFGWHSSQGGQNVDVLAPYDGIVTKVIMNKGNNMKDATNAGNVVYINHGYGLVTASCHLLIDSAVVKAGDQVKTGQKIAKMNNSGYSNGSHDHFIVWLNNVKVDPLKYCYLRPEFNVVGATTKKTWGSKLLTYNPNQVLNPTFTITRDLKQGMKGSDVYAVKKELIKRKYKGMNDNNIFGKGTKKALVKFQKDNNIKNSNPKGKNFTGVCGKATSLALGFNYIKA